MRTRVLNFKWLKRKDYGIILEMYRKEPINTKAILVPSAAVGNDGARKGIIVCE